MSAAVVALAVVDAVAFAYTAVRVIYTWPVRLAEDELILEDW